MQLLLLSLHPHLFVLTSLLVILINFKKLWTLWTASQHFWNRLSEVPNKFTEYLYVYNIGWHFFVDSPMQLSRPMQRKIMSVLACDLHDSEGRVRTVRAVRSLGERAVSELIFQNQNPQHLSSNLWAAVRARGCQFLGPGWFHNFSYSFTTFALWDSTQWNLMQ